MMLAAARAAFSASGDSLGANSLKMALVVGAFARRQGAGDKGAGPLLLAERGFLRQTTTG